MFIELLFLDYFVKWPSFLKKGQFWEASNSFYYKVSMISYSFLLFMSFQSMIPFLQHSRYLHCRDSNSRPLDHVSSTPITTRSCEEIDSVNFCYAHLNNVIGCSKCFNQSNWFKPAWQKLRVEFCTCSFCSRDRPFSAERSDAKLYADNVRRLMSASLKIPSCQLTSQDVQDLRMDILEIRKKKN